VLFSAKNQKLAKISTVTPIINLKDFIIEKKG